MMRLTASCGLRRGELAGLRYEHLDLDKCTIAVCESVTVTPGLGTQIAGTKTGEVGVGVLSLDSTLVEEFRRRRLRAIELGLEFGLSADELYVFSSDLDPGCPLHPDTLSTWVRRFADAHPELPRIRIKDLRAFVASELEGDGADITTAKAVLRHRSELTTLRYYRASREERARLATSTLGERLSSEMGPSMVG